MHVEGGEGVGGIAGGEEVEIQENHDEALVGGGRVLGKPVCVSWGVDVWGSGCGWVVCLLLMCECTFARSPVHENTGSR